MSVKYYKDGLLTNVSDMLIKTTYTPEELIEIYDVGDYASAHNFVKVGDTWHGESQDLGSSTIPLPLESGKRYVIKGTWSAKGNDGIAVQFSYSPSVDNFTISKADEINDVLIYNDLSKGTPLGIDVAHYNRGESWFRNLKVYEIV